MTWIKGLFSQVLQANYIRPKLYNSTVLKAIYKYIITYVLKLEVYTGYHIRFTLGF